MIRVLFRDGLQQIESHLLSCVPAEGQLIYFYGYTEREGDALIRKVDRVAWHFDSELLVEVFVVQA